MQARKSFDAVLEATQSLRVRSRERVDWAAVPSCATDIAVEHDEEMERLSLNNRKRQKIDLTVGNVLYKWATHERILSWMYAHPTTCCGVAELSVSFAASQR